MKLALFTIFRVPNYGSVLQTFATQYYLESLGHKCVFIDYYKKQTLKQKVKAFLSLYNIACILGVRPQFRKPRQLNRFIKRYINLSSRYEGLEALRKVDWTCFDALVVGSDQVWNARYHGKENVYLLPFVDKNARCFSLASSFAVNEIPGEYREYYGRELSKFNAISVREYNGVKIVASLEIGLEAKQILDPTLWLSGEEWQRLFNKTHSYNKPYILLYMWTYAFEPRPYIYEVVKYWKAQLGDCDVIALEGSPKAKECGMKTKDVADSTIPEFMDYFANASLVVTSSFHGTAFALNFERPLISIVPDVYGDDRQSSLLKLVGASTSIVHVNGPIESINPYYDTEVVSENLNKLREQSLNWINSSII